MDARRILLRGLIDDAGMFPPARKPAAQAVADHAAAAGGEARWVLGRFLCPAPQLERVQAYAPTGWRLGVVIDARGDDWLDSVRHDLLEVAAAPCPGAVEVLELRISPGAADPSAIDELLRLIGDQGPPGRPIVFVEVPAGEPDEIEQALDAIAAAGNGGRLGAKLRCGGAGADAFPGDEAVAAFVVRARELNLPFKATAGLHHPNRTEDRELGVLQHGFLNLLAATALSDADALEVIADIEPGAIRLDASGLSWRGHRAGAEAVAGARRCFTAFGSCSFGEPIEELAALGALPGSSS